jgi:phosphatidylglycerophosphate synthase
MLFPMKIPGITVPTPPPAQGIADQIKLARDSAMHLGAMGVLVVGLSVAGAKAADLDMVFAVHATAFFGLGTGLIWRGLRHHPFGQFGAANLVTLVRLAAVSLLAALAALALGGASPELAHGTAWALVAVTTVTALLDGVDGAFARRSGLASDFGARFDMETDAAFILVLAVLVMQYAGVGPWILAVGLMRYIFVAAASIWPCLSAPLAPSRRRQTVCVLQVVALIGCLMPGLPPAIATLLGVLGMVGLTLSFAIDIFNLLRQARTT